MAGMKGSWGPNSLQLGEGEELASVTAAVVRVLSVGGPHSRPREERVNELMKTGVSILNV